MLETTRELLNIRDIPLPVRLKHRIGFPFDAHRIEELLLIFFFLNDPPPPEIYPLPLPDALPFCVRDFGFGGGGPGRRAPAIGSYRAHRESCVRHFERDLGGWKRQLYRGSFGEPGLSGRAVREIGRAHV